jgi:hypothetical protein
VLKQKEKQMNDKYVSPRLHHKARKCLKTRYFRAFDFVNPRKIPEFVVLAWDLSAIEGPFAVIFASVARGA